MEDWKSKLEVIRKMVPKEVTDIYFKQFVAYCEEIGANPLLKEVIVTAYFDKKKREHVFSMVTSRDYFRRRAQEQSTFQGQDVQAVFDKDEFSVEVTTDGVVLKHKHGFHQRGALLGAYSVTRDSKLAQPHLEVVMLAEYKKDFGLWGKCPQIMIRKVACATGLRAVYTGVLGGVYDESENWLDDGKSSQKPGVAKPVTPVVGKPVQAAVNTPPASVAVDGPVEIRPGVMAVKGVVPADHPAAVAAPVTPKPVAAATPAEPVTPAVAAPVTPAAVTREEFEKWATAIGVTQRGMNAMREKMDVPTSIKTVMDRGDKYPQFSMPPWEAGVA